MIAPGVIILWLGSHATIPSGYVRYTDLDGRYPKGSADGVNPGSAGGAASHTHTSPSHTHSIVGHSHTGTTTTTGSYADNTNGTSDAQIMTGSHSHSFTTSTTSGGDISGSVTYGAAPNDPAYMTVIFIQAIGYQAIPEDAVIYINDDNIPDGFSNHAGLNTRFPKGAEAEADAGATGDGRQHVHSINHGHTPVTHTHTGTSSTESHSNKRDRQIAEPAGSGALWPHSHTITLSGSSQAVNDFSGSLTTSESIEPAYTLLRPIQNTSGSRKLAQKKMVALWPYNLSLIPAGWQLCDGDNDTIDMRGRYLKGSTTDGQLGNTGGSNTHTHAAQSHSHTSSGNHTHSGSVSAHVPSDRIVGNGIAPASPYQNHGLSTVSSEQATYGAANTTANSSSNEPLYREVAFIEFVSSLAPLPPADLL